MERTREISFSCHAADVGLWKVYLSTCFSLHASHSNDEVSLLGSPLHLFSGTVSGRCTKNSCLRSPSSAVSWWRSPWENSKDRYLLLQVSAFQSVFCPSLTQDTFSFSSLLQIFRDLFVIIIHWTSCCHLTFQIEGNTRFCTMGREGGPSLPKLQYKLRTPGRNADTLHVFFWMMCKCLSNRFMRLFLQTQSSFSLKYANDTAPRHTEVHIASVISKDPSSSSKRVSVYLLHKQLHSLLIQTFRKTVCLLMRNAQRMPREKQSSKITGL